MNADMSLQTKFILFCLLALFTTNVNAQIFKQKADQPKATPEAEKEKEKPTTAPGPSPEKKKPVNNVKWTPPKIQKKKEPIPEPVKEEKTNESVPPETVTALQKSNETLQSQVADIDNRLKDLTNEGKLSTEQKARKEALNKRLSQLEEKKAALNAAIANGLDPAIVETSKKEIDAEIAATLSELTSIQPVSAATNIKAIKEIKDEVSAIDGKLAEMEARLAAQDEKIASYEPSSGFVIKGPGESSLKISGLLQTRMEIVQDDAPNGDNVSFGTYIRRMRLMFIGKLTDWLNFFVETDQANWGLNGNWTGRMFIQDAYAEFNIHPALQIDVGMLLPPFSRHGIQAATTLLGMDYHSVLEKYPTGGSFVWRDMGIMVRGLVFKDIVDYRLALLSGVHGSATDPRNPNDVPRLTGRLTFNVFDPEGGPGAGGMFFDGLYISETEAGLVSTKRILSFGASFDWQSDLNVEIEDPSSRTDPLAPYVVLGKADYIAASGDIFWDMPLDKQKLLSLNGQLNFYYYNHGDRRSPNGYWYYNEIEDALCYTGWGLLGELGVRYSYFQPLFLLDLYESIETDGNIGDYVGFAGGFNYYMRGHGTTFKLQVGADQKNGGDWITAAKLQVQLIF